MTEFTFRLDNDLKEAFNRSAKAGDRTGAQLIRDFMRDYIQSQREAVDYDAWFREQVRIGLESAKSSRLIPAEDVEAEFAERRAASLKRAGGMA